jgi:hypothetical protein
MLTIPFRALPLRWILLLWLFIILLTCRSDAQFKGDHIPGFIGLSSGTEAPPGVYLGNLVWVYPTDTIKDNGGNSIHLPAGLTSTADIILVSAVTNYKLLGGNVGGSVAFPFIKNRLQSNSLDVNTGFAWTDMFANAQLGWSFKRADVTAIYNLYMPTGRYSPGATDNTGLGMWASEPAIGTTVYLDKKRMWNAAAMFSLEFNTTDKTGTNIHVGDLGTIEGGFGKTFYKKVSGPIPMITNIGVAGYSQFKITGDSGSDIPVPLQGLKDRVFALGPEFNTYIPKPRLTFLVRYEPEFAARNRLDGQTILISVAWVAKSLMKHP